MACFTSQALSKKREAITWLSHFIGLSQKPDFSWGWSLLCRGNLRGESWTTRIISAPLWGHGILSNHEELVFGELVTAWDPLFRNPSLIHPVFWGIVFAISTSLFLRQLGIQGILGLVVQSEKFSNHPLASATSLLLLNQPVPFPLQPHFVFFNSVAPSFPLKSRDKFILRFFSLFYGSTYKRLRLLTRYHTSSIWGLVSIGIFFASIPCEAKRGLL